MCLGEGGGRCVRRALKGPSGLGSLALLCQRFWRISWVGSRQETTTSCVGF